MSKMSMPAFMGSKMLAPGATTGGYSPYRGPVPDKRARLGWWDVADPVAYFGIKGERTEEQKERVRQFREDWGDPKGGAVLNGFINGEYTAQQVDRYFGSTNFNAMIESDAYQGTIGSYEGDFGAFLQQEWDNLGSWLGDNTTLDMELGVLNTTPTQGLGGPRGAERGATLNTNRLAQEEYMQAIKAAAKEADVPLIVDSPDGAVYELNVGQFGDVGLGEYKQTKEPAGFIDFAAQIAATVIKSILTAGVTGAIGSAISDVMGFAQTVQTADEVRENVGVLQQIVDTYIENKDLVDDIMGTVEDVISTEGVVPEDVEIDSSVSDAADQQPADEVVLPAQTTVEDLEPSYQDQVVEAIEAGAEGDISDAKDSGDLDIFVDTTDDDTIDPYLTPGSDEIAGVDEVLEGGEGIDTILLGEDDVVVTQEELEEIMNDPNHPLHDWYEPFEDTDKILVDADGNAVPQGSVVLRNPQIDAGGSDTSGGGAADSGADEAAPADSGADEADVTSTTDDSGDGNIVTQTGGIEDRPFAVPNGPWVYIGQGRWVQVDPDVLAQEGAVIDNGDGTYSVDPSVYEDDSNWVRTAEDPSWNPDNPEVFDVGDTGDIVGSGEEYDSGDTSQTEDTTDEEVIIDLFPTDSETTEETTPETTEETTLETTTTTTIDDTGLDTGGTDDGGLDDDGLDTSLDTGGTDSGGLDDGGLDTGGTDDGEGGGGGGADEGEGDEGDGKGDGEGEGDGTGDGSGGGDTPVQPQRKPFTPEPIKAGLLTGSVPYQDIPFVGVPYEQKDYMMELNSLINRSLFGDLIK